MVQKELIYETETDSQTWRMNLRLPVREGSEEGIVREFRMDVYTLLYLKWITNKDLLYSTGTSAQCYVAAWMGEEFGCERSLCMMAKSCYCPPETIATLLVGYTPI